MELVVLVVADEQRVDAGVARAVSADDELLLFVEFQLQPRVAAFAGDVLRVLPLGNHTFEAETAHRGDDVACRAG